MTILYINLEYNKKIIHIKTCDIQELIDTSECDYTIKSYIKSLCLQLFNYAIQNDIPVNKNYAEFVEIKSCKKSTLHKNINEKDINTLWKNINDIQDIDLALIYI